MVVAAECVELGNGVVVAVQLLVVANVAVASVVVVLVYTAMFVDQRVA